MVNSLYDEIVSMESAVDLMFTKLDFQFNMLMFEHEQNLAEIEYKSINESASYDDLVNLYYAEAEETAKKSKSILGSIVDAIKRMWKKIKDFIFGTKDESKNPDEKVTLPEDPEKLEKETRGLIGRFKAFLSGKKDVVKDAALTGTVSGVFSTTSGAATSWVMNKLSSLTDDVNSVMNDADKQIQSGQMTPEKQKECKGFLSRIQNCGTRAMNCMKKIVNKSPKTDKSEPASNENSDGTVSTLNPMKEEIGKLERENKVISDKMKQIRDKLNGNDKNDSWKDKREIKKLEKLSEKPAKELSPKERTELQRLRRSRGVQDGDERTKLANMMEQLKTRYNDNNSKIDAIKRNERKSNIKKAKEAKKNVANGTTSTDDLLKSADNML